MSDGRIICFGECMVELSQTERIGIWRTSFAGDTANVAIYAARMGHDTHYMTGLGDDAFSQEIRSFLDCEGVVTDLAMTDPAHVPGLYAIRTDKNGERSFTYWREDSAARHFFTLDEAEAALEQAATARLLYLSGITLSLFDEAGRARIGELAARVRANGGDVAFDGNYRARGWPNATTARAAMRAIAPQCSIVLPTFEDEQALFGDTDYRDSLARWHGSGAALVALKLGPQGAIVSSKRGESHVPIEAPRHPRDTTGAGDSFNAAFLCTLLDGADPLIAAQAGNRLAGEVVMHHGAIIPRAAMPDRMVPV